SFERHKIDWKEINQKFRPMVNADTSEDQLFEIFEKMLEPLHDRHVLVQKFPPNTSLKKAWLKTAVKSFQGRRSDPALSDQDLEKSKKIIPKYLNGPMQEFC